MAKALDQPAEGPFPASVESLETQPAFRAVTTSNDPDSATAVYVTHVDFPSDGEWRIAAMIKEGNQLKATLLPSAIVGQFTGVPRVGAAAAEDPHADARIGRRRPLEDHHPDPAGVDEPDRLLRRPRQ